MGNEILVAASHRRQCSMQKIVSGAMLQKNMFDWMRQQLNGGNVGKPKRDMTAEQTPPSGAMEGGGAYNNNAEVQATGGAFALRHLRNAARSIALDADDLPIVIADYGSSQGRNSLLPMRAAIEVIQARLGSKRPIFVYHEDLPANDFNALFQLLDKDPQSYALNGLNIFPCAIGRSFYESVLPSNYVHLGWSSYAAMWISRIPMRIPGHFFVHRSTGEVRAAFERQGAQDWERFLSLRAGELRPGGRLVITVPAANDDGTSGLEDLVDHGNATLAEMVDEGAITADERARMVLGTWSRRRRDLLAPFGHDGKFCDLKVEWCETNVVPDVAWGVYERDGNKETVATKHALSFRATFAPTLAGALEQNSDPQRVRAFSDRLERGLKRRLASQPRPIITQVETIVFTRAVRQSSRIQKREKEWPAPSIRETTESRHAQALIGGLHEHQS